MVDNGKNLENIEPKTPEEILKSAVLQFSELGKRADEAGRKEDRDKLLLERAKLIISLPQKIQEMKDRGLPFDDSAMENLEGFSLLAKSAIAYYELKELQNDTFLLKELLADRYESQGSPNLLEKVVNELFPPKNK
jgi:hypothetical protein